MGVLLGGPSIFSQIACVAICQFAWTLFHSIQVGFKRFRNTLIVVTVSVVLISIPLMFQISSPPAYLSLVLFLLICRWIASFGNNSTKGEGTDIRLRKNSVLTISRVFKSINYWSTEVLQPWILSGSKLRYFSTAAVISICMLGWYGSGGLLWVQQSQVALVRGGDGQFKNQLLEPGVHMVWPLVETIVPVDLHGRLPDDSTDQLLLRGVTLDGYNFSISVELTYRLEADQKGLVEIFSGATRGGVRPILLGAVQEGLNFRLATSNLALILPPLYNREDFALVLTEVANQHLEKGQSAITIETITIKREWRDPLLQVPIDGLDSAKDLVNGFSRDFSNLICADNPNCQSNHQ